MAVMKQDENLILSLINCCGIISIGVYLLTYQGAVLNH